jgi:transcriptional regulator with XRE-family HTH domain
MSGQALDERARMVPGSTIIPIDAMNFAQRLVALRKQRGLTQQALADRVGIHVSNIRRYEAGNSQPTLDVLRNLALALTTSADSLLFDDDERGPDDDLRLQFEGTRNLDTDEKDALKALLEGFLLRHDARRWTKVS